MGLISQLCMICSLKQIRFYVDPEDTQILYLWKIGFFGLYCSTHTVYYLYVKFKSLKPQRNWLGYFCIIGGELYDSCYRKRRNTWQAPSVESQQCMLKRKILILIQEPILKVLFSCVFVCLLIVCLSIPLRLLNPWQLVQTSKNLLKLPF